MKGGAGCGETITCRWLGRIGYEDALAAQMNVLEGILESGTHGEMLLLEHEPVYTIGRTRDRTSLGEPGALPYPLFETNRGGQATYHGPGQLVGYPLLPLARRGRDLHRYIRFLEGYLIGLAGTFGIEARQREGLTGVWVGERKLASIGVGLRHWITMHGFALNVGSDLSAFSAITPCGIAGVTMTSLSRECGREVAVEEVSRLCEVSFPGALNGALPIVAEDREGNPPDSL